MSPGKNDTSFCPKVSRWRWLSEIPGLPPGPCGMCTGFGCKSTPCPRPSVPSEGGRAARKALRSPAAARGQGRATWLPSPRRRHPPLGASPRALPPRDSAQPPHSHLSGKSAHEEDRCPPPLSPSPYPRSPHLSAWKYLPQPAPSVDSEFSESKNVPSSLPSPRPSTCV